MYILCETKPKICFKDVVWGEGVLLGSGFGIYIVCVKPYYVFPPLCALIRWCVNVFSFGSNLVLLHWECYLCVCSMKWFFSKKKTGVNCRGRGVCFEHFLSSLWLLLLVYTIHRMPYHALNIALKYLFISSAKYSVHVAYHVHTDSLIVSNNYTNLHIQLQNQLLSARTFPWWNDWLHYELYMLFVVFVLYNLTMCVHACRVLATTKGFRWHASQYVPHFTPHKHI